MSDNASNDKQPPHDPDNPNTGSDGDSPADHPAHDDAGRDVNNESDYGVRLTGEELEQWKAKYQRPAGGQDTPAPQTYGTFIPHSTTPESGSEYGNQQSQYPSSEYNQGYSAQQFGGPAGAGQPPMQPHPGMGYPGRPGYPAQPQATMPPPRQIILSRNLIWVAGAINVVMSILMAFFTTADNLGVEQYQMIEQMLEQQPTLNTSVEEFIAGPFKISMIVISLVSGVLYWLIGRGIAKGSRVARIFGTIFAVFSLFGIISLDIIWIGLGIAGIALAYTKPATEYFRYKAWEKVQRMQMRFPGPPPQQ